MLMSSVNRKSYHPYSPPWVSNRLREAKLLGIRISVFVILPEGQHVWQLEVLHVEWGLWTIAGSIQLEEKYYTTVSTHVNIYEIQINIHKNKDVKTTSV